MLQRLAVRMRCHATDDRAALRSMS
jgi:hypothetical protein